MNRCTECGVTRIGKFVKLSFMDMPTEIERAQGFYEAVEMESFHFCDIECLRKYHKNMYGEV